MAKEIEMSGVGINVGGILLLMFLFLTLCVWYGCRAVAVYRLSRLHGVCRAWTAFIPFYHYRTEGRLGDVCADKNGNSRKFTVLMTVCAAAVATWFTLLFTLFAVYWMESPQPSGSMGIIGGADYPTLSFLTFDFIEMLPVLLFGTSLVIQTASVLSAVVMYPVYREKLNRGLSVVFTVTIAAVSTVGYVILLVYSLLSIHTALPEGSCPAETGAGEPESSEIMP